MLDMENGSGSIGGQGGYSYGTFKIVSDTTVYICVGGQGKMYSSTSGGYNGGGNSHYYSGSDGTGCGGSGGGATHIGLKNGILTTFANDYSTKLLLVAGGGGGGNGWSANSNGDVGNSTRSNNSIFGQGTQGDTCGAGGGGGFYGGTAVNSNPGYRWFRLCQCF